MSEREPEIGHSKEPEVIPVDAFNPKYLEFIDRALEMFMSHQDDNFKKDFFSLFRWLKERDYIDLIRMITQEMELLKSKGYELVLLNPGHNMNSGRYLVSVLTAYLKIVGKYNSLQPQILYTDHIRQHSLQFKPNQRVFFVDDAIFSGAQVESIIYSAHQAMMPAFNTPLSLKEFLHVFVIQSRLSKADLGKNYSMYMDTVVASLRTTQSKPKPITSKDLFHFVRKISGFEPDPRYVYIDYDEVTPQVIHNGFKTVDEHSLHHVLGLLRISKMTTLYRVSPGIFSIFTEIGHSEFDRLFSIKSDYKQSYEDPRKLAEVVAGGIV